VFVYVKAYGKRSDLLTQEYVVVAIMPRRAIYCLQDELIKDQEPQTVLNTEVVILKNRPVAS